MILLLTFSFCIFGIVLSLFTGRSSFTDDQIFMIIRIPRTILGLAVGGGLSVAGVVIQSTLSNPMADPYTLGIASAAALGAFVGNFIFHGRFGGNTLFAFIFSLLYLFFFLKLLKNRFTDTTQMILTGVICGFFLTAITTFFEAISDPSMWGQQLNWLLGSLTSLPLDQSIFTLVIIILISIICWIHWKPLDVLSVDTLSAMNVGLNIETYRKRFYLLVSLLTAISVSVAGIVGFIGFIIPHTIRLMGIQTHRLLIPCSFFAGAGLLLFADSFSRILLPSNELPVGVLLALIGAPVFLILLRRLRGENNI